ncbi:hypothetical protein [Streptomyces sp. CMB-StM0423]|uniref:hypothetical protein n=1 Tax=Streptomyces sp. CMB-StM0423 TaxID=2059884 RepID=UPI00131B2D0E|nr:hypothetical protein [Streptomyces sp. CMB-StM0423]
MTTTRIHIDNQAGKEHSELADRLRTIIAQCEPLVAETVGMGLPAELTIRMFNPRAWRTRVMDNMRGMFAEEVRALTPDPLAVKNAYRQLRVQGVGLRLTWMLFGPRTVTLPDGTREIWFMPDSARHAGIYHHDELTLAFAHELIHPAQHHRSPELLATFGTPFPQQRGLAGRAVMPFVEGHATWGGIRIATEVLGHAPEKNGPDRQTPSRRFRFWHRGFRDSRKATYEDPVAFFTQVIEGTDEEPGLGVDRFNGVWADIDCFPTTEEMSNAKRWLERVRPLLAETHPGSSVRIGDDR